MIGVVEKDAGGKKFNKQVFDGRRNDPRDVPRMAPLRLPEARAREVGRH